jgi:hypothetical protein
MAKAVKPDKLGETLAKELGIYHEQITTKVNLCSAEAAKELVQKTKATAPKESGNFRKAIASKLLKRSPGGDTYVWYVKAPKHRITHLLVHGHAKQNDDRVKGDPFLHNALEEVLPDYEKNIEEAIKK